MTGDNTFGTSFCFRKSLPQTERWMHNTINITVMKPRFISTLLFTLFQVNLFILEQSRLLQFVSIN